MKFRDKKRPKFRPKSKPAVALAVNAAKSTPNLLRMDPSKTLTLRRALGRELSLRFQELEKAVVEFVVRQDVFGLAPRDDVSAMLLNANPHGCNQYTGPNCSTNRPHGPGHTATHLADDLISQARRTVKSITDRASRYARAVRESKALKLLKAPGVWMKRATQFSFKKLSDRYGRRNAIGIFAAGQLLSWGAFGLGLATSTVIYIPSLVATAPFAALAEVYHQVKPHKETTNNTLTLNHRDLSPDELMALGHTLILELQETWDRCPVYLLDELVDQPLYIRNPEGREGDEPVSPPEGFSVNGLLGKIFGGKTLKTVAGGNCGTGAGGFKPGNTCAQGGSSLPSPGKTEPTKSPEFKAWFGNSKVVDHKGNPQETAEAELHTGPAGEPKPVFHGNPRGVVTEFKKEWTTKRPEDMHFGPGFYFTEDHEAAKAYAAGATGSKVSGVEKNPGIGTYYLKSEKPFDADKHKIDPSKLPEVDRKSVRSAYVQKILSEEGRSEALEAGRRFDSGEITMSYKELTSAAGVGGYGASKVGIQRHLMEQGFDSITVVGPDAPGGKSGGNRFWVVFEPTQIKSPHAAKFDPHDPIVLHSESSPVANVFCATGSGGGVDPSCSPGNSGPKDGQMVTPTDLLKGKGIQLHGTSSETLESVKVHGLLPFGGDKGKSIYTDDPYMKAPERRSGVYTSRDWEEVRAAATNTVFGSHDARNHTGTPKGDIVIFRIRVPEGAQLDPDEYKPKSAKSVRVRGAIPPEWIEGYIIIPAAEVKSGSYELVEGAYRQKKYRYHTFSPTVNVFCATGEGGGVDPTCKVGSKASAPAAVSLEEVKGNLPETMRRTLQHKLLSVTVHQTVEDLRTVRTKELEAAGERGDPTTESMSFFNRRTGALHLVKDTPKGIIAHEMGHVVDGPSRGISTDYAFVKAARAEAKKLSDYAQTSPDEALAELMRLREELGPKAVKKLAPKMVKALSSLGYKDFAADVPTTNAEDLSRVSVPDKVKAFRDWLGAQVKGKVTNKSTEDLVRQYVEAALTKGVARSYKDTTNRRTKTAGLVPRDPEAYATALLNTPGGVDKLRHLATRAYNELEGVTNQMGLAMSRVLSDGLVRGDSPATIAKALTEQVGISRNRAHKIARTEIVRAHAEGQLDALENMGIQEVGAMIEWDANNTACPACRALDGVLLKVNEARGLLPRHPNCTCAWLPNVDGTGTGLKRTKRDVTRALAKSRRVQGDSFASGVTIGSRRPTANESCSTDCAHTFYTPHASQTLGTFSWWLTHMAPQLGIPVENYNPAQLRDQFGRWSKGGGHAPGIVIKPEHRAAFTREEKREFNQKFAERTKLNNKIKKGEASEQEKQLAQAHDKRIAELREIARKRVEEKGKAGPLPDPKPRPKPEPIPVKPEPSKPDPVVPPPPPSPSGNKPADYPRPVQLPGETAEQFAFAESAWRRATSQETADHVANVREKMKEHGAELDALHKKVMEVSIDHKKLDELEKKFHRASSAYADATYANADAATRNAPLPYTGDEIVALQRVKNAAAREHRDLLVSGQARALMALEHNFMHPGQISPHVSKAIDADDERTAAVNRFSKDFSGLMHPDLVKQANLVEVHKTPGQSNRSHFRGVRHGGSGDGIYIAKGSDHTVIAHEIGHGLESHPKVYALSNGFLHHRVGGERTSRDGMKGLDSHEVGREDKFPNQYEGSRKAYIGKHYTTRDTEVLSSGMEMLARDAVKFAKDDPEYFKFVVGVLSGRLL